jgi:hypothetical protein
VRAVAQGIRSTLSLPLTAEGKHIGALHLYAPVPAAFGPAETRRAESLAANATGALALAVRQAATTDLTSQLRTALASRAVIDQALGVIMAQERCTQAQAFAILRSASQNRNVKLRDIATKIVTNVTGEPPQPPPFEITSTPGGRPCVSQRRVMVAPVRRSRPAGSGRPGDGSQSCPGSGPGGSGPC